MWESGTRLEYVIEEHGTTQFGEGARSFELNTSLILDTVWEVQSASPDGGAMLRVSIGRVRFTGDGKVHASSVPDFTVDTNNRSNPKKQPARSVAEVLKSYVGHVADIAVDGRGKVVDVSLSEHMSKKLEESKARELAGFFGGLFTTNGIGHRLTAWLVEFPAGELSHGRTWRREQPSPIRGDVLDIRAYEVLGPVDHTGDARIHIQLTPQFQVRAGSDTKIVRQDGDGHVHLDPETHQIQAFGLRQQSLIEDAYSAISISTEYTATLRPPGAKVEESSGGIAGGALIAGIVLALCLGIGVRFLISKRARP